MFPILEALSLLEEGLGNFTAFPLFGEIGSSTAGEIPKFSIGMRSFKLEDGDVMVPFKPKSVNNTILSMEKADGDADYQTPASGTIPLVVIQIRSASTGTSRVVTLFENGTADSESGATELMKNTNFDSDEAWCTLWATDVSNSKYINIKNSHTSNITAYGFAVERA